MKEGRTGEGRGRSIGGRESRLGRKDAFIVCVYENHQEDQKGEKKQVWKPNLFDFDMFLWIAFETK